MNGPHSENRPTAAGKSWGQLSEQDRDPMLKLHPDIVAYEELPKSTQEKDKAIARAIPKFLQAGHLAQVRVETGTQ